MATHGGIDCTGESEQVKELTFPILKTSQTQGQAHKKRTP